MRWDILFDDLEGQLERELAAEEQDLEAENERLRLSRLSLRDRLVAVTSAGADADGRITLALADGSRLAVRPATIGRDWLSAELESEHWDSCVIPITAIAAIHLGVHQVQHSLGTSPRSAAPAISERLGLAYVLRDLCRRRTAVELAALSGRMHGTIDRVGGDHLDLAVHEPGTARRASAVTEYRIVPFSEVVIVRI